ncbi:MAG: hypothetical protein NTW45_10110 [Rhodocyclales bacterium]|nr:hypothetical protein [Rhodocyclales bacterium]
MAAKERNGRRPGKLSQDSEQPGRVIGSAVNVAINRGFVVGREVLVGCIPGIVVGYNIASFGRFVGSAYPLVVRTALGVTKCGMDEVSLA